MMEQSPTSGQRIAALLLDAGCVSMRGDEPFRLPSGWASPFYMDCRRLISFPQIRRDLVAACLASIEASGIRPALDAVVAGETSGIAFGAWIADRLDLPLHYVRKNPRGGRQLEGDIVAGQRVLLVDDLMAAGVSKSNFLQAITAAGATAADLLVIFDYATFGAAQHLLQQGVRTHALATCQDILQVARARAQFDSRSLADLADFISGPAQWSQKHGGIAG
ncbi:orotate phosphoribosyltransferase [Kerstersia sp.]|uniref:orotate phosphoribosyltransferase n=1 Tax=Kerstersia sp. TaxID=1930783 RepID=UPI003F8E22D2